MQKINYFEILEELALLCSRSVFLAVSSSRSQLQKALTEAYEAEAHATEMLNELEGALFKDFLPPLERRSIAEASHRLCKIISLSAQILSQRTHRPLSEKHLNEARGCIELSVILEESVTMLKKIKKPNQLPKSAEFRKILNGLRISSRAAQKKQNQASQLLCELREELSACFDGIIEIMLCNI